MHRQHSTATSWTTMRLPGKRPSDGIGFRSEHPGRRVNLRRLPGCRRCAAAVSLPDGRSRGARRRPSPYDRKSLKPRGRGLGKTIHAQGDCKMADDELFFIRERQLEYPVFDSDNHMYENTDAFTKFIPSEYSGVVTYIAEGNRSKLAIKDRISRAIPNPTFQRVAPPGGQKDDPLQRRSIPGLDAFFDVEPRYKLMQEFGITRSLMWPTLASVIEQGMPEDPLATHVVLHALNEWMYEHWTFGYEDAVFATPAIGLAIVDRAIKELEWVTDRGARIVYIRPAPVFGFGGPRSFALPEFDPFWEAIQERDVVVGLHNTVNRRYPVDLADLDGSGEAGGYFDRPYGATAPFRALATPRSQTSDLIASMIGHGMLARFPRLKRSEER